MQCPKCASLKQLTPESRRTETSVWRRRVCKVCHHTWVTEEHIRPEAKMPTEVWQFNDAVMRQAPKEKAQGARPREVKSRFDTITLAKFMW